MCIYDTLIHETFDDVMRDISDFRIWLSEIYRSVSCAIAPAGGNALWEHYWGYLITSELAMRR